MLLHLALLFSICVTTLGSIKTRCRGEEEKTATLTSLQSQGLRQLAFEVVATLCNLPRARENFSFPFFTSYLFVCFPVARCRDLGWNMNQLQEALCEGTLAFWFYFFLLYAKLSSAYYFLLGPPPKLSSANVCRHQSKLKHGERKKKRGTRTLAQ